MAVTCVVHMFIMGLRCNDPLIAAQRGHVLVMLRALVVRRVRAQRSGSLPVSVALWPVFLAVAGLAVDLRLVRRHGGAVQRLPAAHCGTEAADT